MGFAKKAEAVVVKLQNSVKITSVTLINGVLKVLSGLVVGLTFALAGQELIHYSNFSFTLMLVSVSSMVVRAIWNLSLVGVIVFDLVVVLLGLVFRMYLLMAP